VELKQIKELMTAMGRTGTKRLTLKKDGFELQVEREESGSYKGVESILDLTDEPSIHMDQLHRTNVALSRARESSSLGGAHVAHQEAPKETSSLFVTSPMVGTFYASPSPDDAPFAKVGDKIEKNTVVCIIEAMKVMNEVKAGVNGTIYEVLVESGHPVEFGTKLFRIIP
jgi:acetyl-CoA carboxylase biotin carboxyl carrier protein